MTVSKINFTAENNLLGNMYNKVSTQQKATTTAVTAIQPQEEQTAATEQAPKSHKLRNWSIGMGSAATLIALGVLGRKGYLGEGVQKLLGGIKKNASDIADDLKGKGEELLEGRTPKAPEKIEPEVFGPETTTDIEPPIKPETPVKPKPQVTTQAGVRIEGTLSKAEMDAINAGLDRTIPQIDKKLFTTEIPDIKPLIDEFNSIDVSKLKEGVNEITLPNGNIRKIYVSNGKISKIYDKVPDGKRILSVDYIEGELYSIRRDNEYFLVNSTDSSYCKEINGNDYWYNSDGRLDGITEYLPNNQIRCTYINENATDIRKIEYCDAEYKTIKKEHFIDGKLAIEEFGHGKDITRVTHDLSK